MEFVNSQSMKISVRFFSKVQNPQEIQIPNEAGAVIDLIHVCSVFHLQIAVKKALANIESSSMKTKSVQAEICYFLTGSKNFNDSVRKVSPVAGTSDIAVVSLSPPSEELLSLEHIHGEEEDPSIIERLLTPEKVDRLIAAFKLTAEEVSVSGLSDAIAMKIAIKDYA